MKKMVLVLLALVLAGAGAPGVLGAQEGPLKPWDIPGGAQMLLALAEAAEAEGRAADALVLRQELLRRYPGSPEALTAQGQLRQPGPAAGGLGHYFTLYAGQIAWSTTSSITLFNALRPADLEGSGSLLALAGLVGVGGGIGSAYLLHQGSMPSLGTLLWMETLPWLLGANLMQGYFNSGAFSGEDAEAAWRSYYLLAGLGGWAANLGTYYALKDADPSLGQYAAFLSGYGHGGLYAVLLLSSPLFRGTALGAEPGWTLQAAGVLSGVGMLFWQPLDPWTWERRALTALGGGVGALVGGLLHAVGNGFPMDGWEPIYYLSWHLGGTLLTTWLTSGFANEVPSSGPAEALTWNLVPTFDEAGRPGARVSLRF